MVGPGGVFVALFMFALSCIRKQGLQGFQVLSKMVFRGGKKALHKALPKVVCMSVLG